MVDNSVLTDTAEKQSNRWLDKALNRIPVISRYVQLRGTAFVVSWLHRAAGVLIVGFIGFHLLTLQALRDPALYDARMLFYSHPLLTALEWGLAFPVMFHAFNGGRLILFESFGWRNDDTLLSWVAGLWLLYCGLLGITMLAGGQTVSAVFFWLWTLAGAIVLVYKGWRQIWPTAHALSWKLQRLSGLFLLVMLPAHLLFMHLNPLVAKDAGTVLARLQNPFNKIVDIALAAAVLYHGAYGLISISTDYLSGRVLRRVIALVVAAIAIIFGLLAVRLMLRV